MRDILWADQEDNVPLRRVDIIILQEKDFVNAVLLKCRELNKKPDWPCKSLLNDQVLLSPNLQTVNENLAIPSEVHSLTYAFKQTKKVFPCLFLDWIDIDTGMRCHIECYIKAKFDHDW